MVQTDHVTRILTSDWFRSSAQVDIIPSDQIKLDKENVLKDKEEEKTKKEAAEDLFSAHDFDITIGTI